MLHILHKLVQESRCPDFVPDTLKYLCLGGSQAYGTSTEDSDIDLYGFCIPPADIVFPHLHGEITGFGRQTKRFEQFNIQLKPFETELNKCQYDITIYNIIKFFKLCMDNNPYMLDILFCPDLCVLRGSNIWNMIKYNRDDFLHKGCYHKYRGYAHSQQKKMQSQNRTGKRKEIVDKFGYDTKYAYHFVRLMLECEMILKEHTLNIDCNSEILNEVKSGAWTLSDILLYCGRKDEELEELYNSRKLRYGPDEEHIRNILLTCLEEEYGSLKGMIVV